MSWPDYMAQICFDTSKFYTVIITGISVIMYVIITIYNEKLEEAKNMVLPVPPPQPQSVPLEVTAQIQRIDDMSRMHNPLIPPMRRGPFNYTGAVGVPVGIPTRGEYGSFQQMGYLYNANDVDQAMPLVGRRIHSNQYEYYTFHHNNPNIKIPIKIQGNREISDSDVVTVQGYANTFQAKIYELDSLRYVPY